MRLTIQMIGMIILFDTTFATAGVSNSAPQLAFAEYAAKVEARLSQQHTLPERYLAVLDCKPLARRDLERQLRSGALQVVPVNGGSQQVKGGLLHHWRGAAFIPGATAEDMLNLLRDCSALPRHYAPQVQSCHVLRQTQDVADIAIRTKMRKVATVLIQAVSHALARLPR